MCDERERLISYLYEEAVPSERAEVEAHLEDCHVCRAEIAGLRRVREDLLAWSVPESNPIWRPVAPPAPAPAWRQMPAWAMAAAASLVFAAGAAGGAATRVLWPVARPALAIADNRPAGATQLAPAVTERDLAALEARVLERVERVRTEMGQQMRAVSSRQSAMPAPTLVAAARSADTMATRLAELEQWRDDQISLNLALNQNINKTISTTNRLDTQMTFAQEYLRRVNNTGAFPGGR